jgi:integrase
VLNQGPRRDEIVPLLKTDVDLEHQKMYIRKGKSRAARRKLDLTAESCRILAERMASESPWIFASSRNPGQDVARINNAHDRILVKTKKGGIEFGFVLYILGIPSRRAWPNKESTWRHSRKFSATIRSASRNAIFIRRMSTRRVPWFAMKQPK